jgi:hypothetical protein
MICRLRIRKPALRNRSCGVERSGERSATALPVAVLLTSRSTLRVESKRLALEKEMQCHSAFTRLDLRS